MGFAGRDRLVADHHREPLETKPAPAHRAEPEVRVSEKWPRFSALDDALIQE